MGRELYDGPIFSGISERREDFPAHAKIRMMHVRGFNRFRKTESEFAKSIRGHLSQCLSEIAGFDPVGVAVGKEIAAIQAKCQRADAMRLSGLEIGGLVWFVPGASTERLRRYRGKTRRRALADC